MNRHLEGKSQMNKFEYEFMTDQWEGPGGAAYNQCYETCKGFGWMGGFDKTGKPIPTAEGLRQIKLFEGSIDVV